MSRNTKNKRKVPMTYINVTPLVDVMLVLIVILMIATPVMNAGVQVDLPKTQATTMNDQNAPVIISIDKDQKLYIEDAEVTLEELVTKLPSIMESGKSNVIYVRGDKSLNYGTIMEIMGIISASGAAKVSLVSEVGTDNNVKVHSKAAPKGKKK